VNTDPQSPAQWRECQQDFQTRAAEWRVLAGTVADQSLPRTLRDDFVSRCVEGFVALAGAAEEAAYCAGIFAVELEDAQRLGATA
jgi:hypothetical protein